MAEHQNTSHHIKFLHTPMIKATANLCVGSYWTRCYNKSKNNCQITVKKQRKQQGLINLKSSINTITGPYMPHLAIKPLKITSEFVKSDGYISTY